MNKTNRIFLVVCSFLFCSLCSGFLYADVTVVFNGETVEYTQTPPKIINGRTMVPLWETAGLLEMDVAYDPATKNITITKDGRVMTHTTGTNTLVIDGQWRTFDQGSAVEDGRTLLPLEMLRHVLDAEAIWDPDSKKVLITTKQTVPVTATVAEGALQFGRKADVAVQTPSDVTAVKLTDNLGNLLTQSVSPTAKGQAHVFNVSFVPLTTQNPYPIRVYTDKGAGFDDAYILVSFTMKTGGAILDVQYAGNILEGEILPVTVTADTQTKEIRILDSHQLVLDQSSQYTEKNGQRVFTLTPTPYKISSSDVAMSIISITESGQTGDTARIDVSLAAASKTLEIQNIQTSPASPVAGSNVTIQVQTSPLAEKVTISGNGIDATLDSPTEDKISYKVWEYTYTAKLEGAYSYQVEAYDEKDAHKVKQNATVRIYDNGEAKGQIHEIRVDKRTIREGNTFTLTVVTDNQIQEVRIKNAMGNTLGSQTKAFDNASSKIGWDFTLTANQGGDVQIEVQAINRKGESVYKQYTIAVEP